MKLKKDDILFFIIIGLIILVALWLLKGSPTIDNAVISVAIFVATSGLLLWRKYFQIDKNTTVRSMRVKQDINSFRTEMNGKLTSINNKLNNMKN